MWNGAVPLPGAKWLAEVPVYSVGREAKVLCKEKALSEAQFGRTARAEASISSGEDCACTICDIGWGGACSWGSTRCSERRAVCGLRGQLGAILLLRNSDILCSGDTVS